MIEQEDNQTPVIQNASVADGENNNSMAMLSQVNEEAADENLEPVEKPDSEDDNYSPDEDQGDDGIKFTEVKNVE